MKVTSWRKLIGFYQVMGQGKQLLFAKIYYFDFSTKCSENDVNVKIIPRKSENS